MQFVYLFPNAKSEKYEKVALSDNTISTVLVWML